MTRGRRSSSASRSSSSRSKSRAPSRSQSRAPSRSKSRGPPALSRHPSSSAPAAEKDHPSGGSGGGPDLKNSLLFLGTIAAAAFTAHKVWPKGVLYGHKDDWEHEHEHEKKSCRKTPHRQSERGRDRDRSPPRYQTDRPAVYQTSATSTTRRDAPFPEARRSGARPPATGPPPPPQPQQQRKYLPYEPGVYTPSSVTSSASARAFEQRRERPVLLPLEGPRGHLPFVPMAPPAVGRRGNVFEDEGYASRESVPAVRSLAPGRYQEGERGEYRR
ncbi:hypothetical protein B0T18DRAFT_395647 [Schizothecium vesticola]|uniref:Uncharacterized protein n=1 Tax=Schizothecium vesticola TaxID=314040 RepID=A0AA40KBM6_9PEZI|nr:hypothetical protein B0T18DRAFT_395647 [Schizothecium vesticola]